jgi:hypothetical protein
VSGAIVVDYDELHRLSAVWRDTAELLARQALSVASVATEPCIFTNACFDPLGAARAEKAIAAAAGAPHGLAALAARIAADGVALEAVVVKEQLVDGLPIRQIGRLESMLVTAPFRLPLAPAATIHQTWQAFTALGGALVGYASPFAELLLATASPSMQFRADVAMRRPVEVDPVAGIPLSTVSALAPEGAGDVSISRYLPLWHNTPPGSVGGLVHRIANLERWPDASLAVDAVTGADGVTRYVVELPGIRHLGASADPQDLSGAVNAMAFSTTAYTRCVGKALDAAGVPRGAQVLLAGHSQGGIVAMDLAGDPAFNGGRVKVTDVVAVGSPISATQVATGSGTRVFSVENVNDLVTHLDAVDSAPNGSAGSQRVAYQFSDDQHAIGATHAATRYAAHLDALAGSPNPLFRQVEANLAPYVIGHTATTVFTLRDGPH